jgi:replicative DNA helicase
VDKETGGWQNSDLIIIAARPAMGKTAFLLSMARNIAVGHKIPMALFSLEMASVQLITRMIASETRISSEKLRKGTLDDEEWQRLFPMYLNWKMLLYILTKHLPFPYSTSVQNAEDW